MKAKYTIVAICCIALTAVILGVDAMLSGIGWPTISQSIGYWTLATPLVPALVGFFMGGLMMHLFESYFMRDKITIEPDNKDGAPL